MVLMLLFGGLTSFTALALTIGILSAFTHLSLW
jgi:hypothetical protein